MLITMIGKVVVAATLTFLWLYYYGDEFTTLTGGWMAQAWSGASGWTATAPTLTKLASSLRATLSNTTSTVYSGVIRVTNKADLSAVARIRVTLSASLSGPKYQNSGGQNLYLMATAVNSGYWPWDGPPSAGVVATVHTHTSYGTSQTPSPEVLTDVQYILDVSGLPDGTYYISAGFVWYNQYTNSIVTIKSVEMLTA